MPLPLPTKILNICNPIDRQRLQAILNKLETDPNTFPLVDANLFNLFRDSFDDEQRQKIIFLLDFLTVLDGAV